MLAEMAAAISAAGIDACNRLPETNEAARGFPLNCIVEGDTEFVPLTVSMNPVPPAIAELRFRDSEIRLLVRDSDQLQAGYWSQCCTSQTIPTPLDTSSLLEAEARKVRPQPQADVFHDGSEGLCCNVHRSPSLRGSSESHASSQLLE